MRLITRLIAFACALIAVPAVAQVPAARPPVPAITDPENLLYLDLSTGGRVIIWLRPDAAPKTVERIKLLTRQRFFDGLTFHRVIDGFMAQTGDPKGDGTGGSTLDNLPAEFNWLPHVRGTVSAAREGAPDGADAAARKKAEDSANSQFFIVFQPTLKLDKRYTAFGRVIQGMDYVDAVARGEPPATPSRIVRAYVAADNPPAYAPLPPPPPVAAPAPLTLTPTKPAPKVKPAAKRKAA